MLNALRNRTVALLWFGQALSAIGDEIYRVALMWLAVGLIGAKTGYLGAAQSAALLTLSLVGGKWADQWNSLNTMIRVDLFRAAIVLVPVILYFVMPPSLVILVIVALLLAALGAFFDPALQASLPDLCPDPKTLQAANGVMSITSRLARVVGPGIIGFLSAIVPLIHFFTLDALSFMVSAISVLWVKRDSPRHMNVRKEKVHTSFYEAIMSGFQIVTRDRRMRYVMFAKAVTTSTWNLSYSLGFALLVNQLAPHDVKSFSMVIAAYGLGNVIGAFIFANIERKNPEKMMFVGYVGLGIGFILIGCAPTLSLIMAASACAAFFGPMNDVAFVDLMQQKFATRDLTKVFRFRMGVETSGTLICMGLSPLLLRFASVHFMIGLCGMLIFIVGTYGVLTYEKPRQPLEQGPL